MEAMMRTFVFVAVVAAVSLGAATVDAQAPGDKPAEPQWKKAPGALLQDELLVWVSAVKTGPVTGRNLRGDAVQSASNSLHITLTVKNVSKTRKVTYNTWAGADVAVQRDFATLEDEHGNSYRRVGLGLTNQPDGRTNDHSLHPGKTLTDVLHFELPVDAAKSLRLELPYANLGIKIEGAFRFEIPKEMWTKRPSPKK